MKYYASSLLWNAFRKIKKNKFHRLTEKPMLNLHSTRIIYCQLWQQNTSQQWSIPIQSFVKTKELVNMSKIKNNGIKLHTRGRVSQKTRYAEAATEGFLKNFVYFTGKHLCWSLFLIKLQAWRPATLLKRLQHKCFPVKFAKFLRTPILQNICKQQLPNLLYFSTISLTFFT